MKGEHSIRGFPEALLKKYGFVCNLLLCDGGYDGIRVRRSVSVLNCFVSVCAPIQRRLQCMG